MEAQVRKQKVKDIMTRVKAINSDVIEDSETDALAREIILDIQKSFDLSIIGVLLLTIVIISTFSPGNPEEFKRRLLITLPLSGTSIASLVTALYYSFKFTFKSKLRKFVEEEMINKRLSINAYLTPRDRFSLLQVILYLKYISSDKKIDFSDELQNDFSAILES